MKVKSLLDFYRFAQEIDMCNEDCTLQDDSQVITVTLTKNKDPYLESFFQLYQDNVEVWKSLFVALLHCMYAKYKGRRNPEF